MTRKAAIALFALIVSAAPLAAKDYVYAPRLAEPGETVSTTEGLLVREVEVRKGDTLSAISKRFSGRGAYFPQILLFNSIKNPDLIYPGDLLRVPVGKNAKTAKGSKKPSASAPSPSVEKQKTADTGRAEEPKLTPQPAKPATAETKTAAGKPVASEEQVLYARGLAAYKKGDCKLAIGHFEKFIANYPESSLLADVSLYHADCLIKLSSQP